VLTIAQITDLHITTDRCSAYAQLNSERLSAVLAAIEALEPRPAAIFASGDLTDGGRPEEYAALAELIATTKLPVYLGVGNHDRRKSFVSTFNAPVFATDDFGFVQYTVDFDGLRVIMCDTLDEDQDGGAFCGVREKWLARTLDNGPNIPTVLMLHHPPIACGIQWMDPPKHSNWILRLAALLEGRSNVRALACGHVHRPYHGLFGSHLVSVSAATALQLTLNMSPIDMRVADGRQILLGEPPGFTLLSWSDDQLTMHNCVAGEFGHKITYDQAFITSP
jgi:3',5'-cyclic AMP phosphodiesterase CpdA